MASAKTHAASARRRIAVATIVALMAISLPALESTAAGKSASTPPAPVSNAFAMGGDIGGTIDQRTGAFEASVPLVDIAGRAGIDLDLSLGYDQSLAGSGQANRFGLGAGWVLGVPFVDPTGGVHLYEASGGSYTYDPSSPTGLHDYPQRDLVFAKAPGTIPAGPGLPVAQPYVYTLTTYDGTVDRFDVYGNLVEETDSFGNQINLRWQQTGSSWQPTSVVDNYGDVTTFEYSPDTVKVVSPPDSEGPADTVTLTLSQGRLAAMTDPLGQVTTFAYTPVAGVAYPLLSTVVAPNGAHTTVSYTSPRYEPNVVTVSSVKMTDAAGNELQPPRTFDIDPAGDDEHNFTGYPLYNDKRAGTDALFDSGSGYQYTTALSDGSTTVLSTYNSLHLLVRQQIENADPGQGPQTYEVQSYTYPPVASPGNLPANYSDATTTSTTVSDPDAADSRTTTTHASYNDKGQPVSSTNAAGTVTTSDYDPRYGQLTRQVVTGTDGDTSVTTDTLTADGKAIATSTTAVGSNGASPKARTVTSYTYNSSGQVTGQDVAWAPGAAPPGNSGPNQIDTTSAITVDTDAHTSTDAVTTAAGTPDAATTTTVTDLVTGETLAETDPDGLTTSYTYDALGRVQTMTAPGNEKTTYAYPTPLTTIVTDPSGLATETTTDALGRTVKVTDNVSDEHLVASPTARTVSTDSYSVDGSTATTTGTNGTATTTTFDFLQRPTKVVEPGDVTETTSYNDGNGTETSSVLAAGDKSSDPTSTTVASFNDLDQPTKSTTSYGDQTPQPPATTESYNGLGAVQTYSSDGLDAAATYGAGGQQTATTVTPQGQSGSTETASTDNALTGAVTAKTVTASSGSPSTTGATYTYDAAGRVATATTPGGGKTAYTYTPDGQVATMTAPSGAITTNTYSPTTGSLTETVVQAPGGSAQKTAYTYYPATGQVQSVYDPDDPADAITYDYDADGHTTAVHYPDGTTESASYNDTGELATTTDITGATTTYRYDADGRLTGATQTRGGTTLASVQYAYDDLDRVHTITRGNGTVTTIAYDDASQVTSQTTTAADKAVVASDTYKYGPLGNVTSEVAVQAGTDGGPTTTTTTTYRYDGYSRLIGSSVYPNATGTGTPTTTTDYTLNTAGDVTGETITTGGKTTTVTDTIGSSDELTGRSAGTTTATQTYDADGNVTRDLEGDVYTYDVAQQMTSVTTPAGVTTDYTYYPDGTRASASTTVDGVDHTTTYHYDTTGTLINDTYSDGATGQSGGTAAPGAVTASYLFGIQREARTLDPGAGLDGATSGSPSRIDTDAYQIDTDAPTSTTSTSTTTSSTTSTTTTSTPTSTSTSTTTTSTSTSTPTTPTSTTSTTSAAGLGASPSTTATTTTTLPPTPRTTATASTVPATTAPQEGTAVTPPTTAAASTTTAPTSTTTAPPAASPDDTPAGATGETPAPSASDGSGYYVLDGHGSVVAITGAGGEVDATYDYGDYGQAVGTDPAAQATPAATPAANAAVNPFTYDEAYTNPTTGTQYLPARTYDPDEGRFLSLDSADEINRYQAFSTNPIMNTDPTGQVSVPTVVSDACSALLFLIFALASAGAAIPVEAAAEVTSTVLLTEASAAAAETAATAATIATGANVVSAVTNFGAFATSVTLTADDIDDEMSGSHFLSDETRDDLSTANFALGLAAGVSGGVAGAASIVSAREAAQVVGTTEVVGAPPVDPNVNPVAPPVGPDVNPVAPPVGPDVNPVAPPVGPDVNPVARPVDPDVNPVARPVDPDVNPVARPLDPDANPVAPVDEAQNLPLDEKNDGKVSDTNVEQGSRTPSNVTEVTEEIAQPEVRSDGQPTYVPLSPGEGLVTNSTLTFPRFQPQMSGGFLGPPDG